MAPSSALLLDRDVRDWVLVPLTLSIVMMMLLRQYATKFLASGKPSDHPKADDLRNKNTVGRSHAFRANMDCISEAGFRMRKAFFTAKDTGVFTQKVEAPDMQEMVMNNPDFMQGMIKQQLGGVVPQIAMGAFVNYFFSGFILGRVPFALSPKFRLMLQRGIDLPSLDVTYFTSLSYYILLLFGMRGVFMLAFQGEAVDDSQMMRQMQMAPANPMGFDAKKVFEAERQALELVEHRSKIEGSEERAAALLRKQLGHRA